MKNKALLIFRIFAVAVSLFGMSYRLIIDPISGGGFLDNLGYFTIQSGLMVTVIFILLLIGQIRGKPESPPPAIRGAVLLYIAITSVIFLALLGDSVNFTGFSKAVLYINHLLTAILLIIDNVISIKPKIYKWKLLFYWMIYPVAYLIFSIVEGLAFCRFRYPFLNFNEMDIYSYFLIIFMLVMIFIGTGALIIFLNKIYRKTPEQS